MDFNNDRPIYLQIVEMITMDMMAGVYQANDKLPSVRELSARYRVNPNTLQRAFADLESSGLVYTERTNGRFVTNDKEKIKVLRNQAAITAVKEFLQYMNQLDIQDEEIVQLMLDVRKGEIK